MEELKKRIKNQIEYYFSDENLETDIFFNELFSKSIDGYIDISYLLNCNTAYTFLSVLILPLPVKLIC